MRILITDVTEMHGGNFCVAGWNAQEARMVRPLPNSNNWTTGLLHQHGVNPGVTIEADPNGQQHASVFPHRNEDTPVDRQSIIADIAALPRTAGLCARIRPACGEMLSDGQRSSWIERMAAHSDMIFTIGHSIHTYERFLELLRGGGITAVADVRTSPHSRYLPQFNRGGLEAKLRADGIAYSFLGEELGGRPTGRQYYRDGVADYERMATAVEFKRGLKRVIEGGRRYRIALMCAEQDPLDCHRCLLVARALQEFGMKVGHILPDGQIISQSAMEDQLLSMSGRVQDDLFASREEQLSSAYRERARKVAYAEAVTDPIEAGAAE